MKKAFSFLVIAVLCLAIILPASADTLYLYRIDYEGVETFQALHPELQCTWSEQDLSLIHIFFQRIQKFAF